MVSPCSNLAYMKIPHTVHKLLHLQWAWYLKQTHMLTVLFIKDSITYFLCVFINYLFILHSNLLFHFNLVFYLFYHLVILFLFFAILKKWHEALWTVPQTCLASPYTSHHRSSNLSKLCNSCTRHSCDELLFCPSHWHLNCKIAQTRFLLFAHRGVIKSDQVTDKTDKKSHHAAKQTHHILLLKMC